MVMKNRKWNREFPQVPDRVHQSVLQTLDCLGNQEDKKMKKSNKGMKKHAVIAAAAALAAALGMTAAATGIFSWNEKAEEIFEAGEETQNKLVLENVAKEEFQTVTGNGLTVSAVQTIQDSNCFYALFEITAEDEAIRIDENYSMDYRMEFPEGKDPFCALGWHFVPNSRQEVSNSRYFEIFGTKMSEEEYFAVYGEARDSGGEDLRMDITFTTLRGAGAKAMEGDAITEGSWAFSLDVHPAQSIRLEVNREFEINGCMVMVKSVELSPITMTLTCEEAGVRELERKEGINLDQLDALQSMMLKGIEYEDGTLIEEEYYNELVERCGDGIYEKTLRFSKVIDPEKVSKLLLGESRDEIVLK